MMYELIYYMNSYKNNSKFSGIELADMQGNEDGVVGAVDVAEQEQAVVVSCTLTSSKIYEFIYYLNSFIEILYKMNCICHSLPTLNNSSNSGPPVDELQCTSCICGNELCT
jgi:hypothetical protein